MYVHTTYYIFFRVVVFHEQIVCDDEKSILREFCPFINGIRIYHPRARIQRSTILYLSQFMKKDFQKHDGLVRLQKFEL